MLLADEWGADPAPLARALLSAFHVAVVSTLLVAPDRRRNGLARLLLKAGSRAARAAGCGELRLEAGAGDVDLRAFAAETGLSAAGALLARSLRKQG